MLDSIKASMGKVWGRKTFITLVCLVLGTLVDLFSKNGLSSNLLTLMGVLAGAFTVGNGAEHLAQRGKNNAKAVVQTPSVDDQIHEKLDASNASLANVLNTLNYIIQAAGLAGNPQQQQQRPPQANPQANANRQAVNQAMSGGQE